MFSEKLLVLLSTFSKYDLNRFRKFLLSPYFNEQEDLIRLFDLCNIAIRKGPDVVATLDKNQVWRGLYPGKKFDDAHLRRLASELTQLALQFKALETRAQNPVQEWLELQKSLEQPELSKHLSGVERQVKKNMEESALPATTYYLTGFQLHWNIFNRASKVVSNTDFMQKMLPADQFLDYFYIVQKLKFYVSWLIYQGFRATEEKVPIPAGFWDYLKNERFESVPLIAIYQDAILSLSHPEEEEHFTRLLDKLDRLAHGLAKEDLRECYYIAQNYCAFKVNQGKTEYYQVFFSLFKNIIRLGILLENNQLSEGVFKNMITISLRVGEYSWAENFIQEYSIYLPVSIRENARTFNLANLYSHQKQHAKVIELLRDVEYSDVVYSLGAKLILIRTYFDSGEWLALDSLIDSFRIFLRRNKVISKTLKREYNNFLNFVKRLTTLHMADDKTIAAFRRRVMAASANTPKKWLLEKIAEIEGA